MELRFTEKLGHFAQRKIRLCFCLFDAHFLAGILQTGGLIYQGALVRGSVGDLLCTTRCRVCIPSCDGHIFSPVSDSGLALVAYGVD